jgi:amino acid adenylation domain-containing protein
MAEEVFVFPLSYAQQRLWFLDQLEPGSSFYNIFDTLSFDAPLDAQALEQSLNEIVRRHEVLRTTFSDVRGEPVQVIAQSLKLPLPVVDLKHLAEDERSTEASRLSAEEYERPFNLARGPLVRAKLLRMADEESVLFLTMHHIVSDGWSLGILSRELRTLYEAYSAGLPSPLPELPIQYADFTVWQREWLQGDVLEAQMDYWKKQLAGAPSVLKLPTDHPRPSIQNFQQGANQWLNLPRSLTEPLKALSQREGATLFITLLAAFNVLLHRYTHQTDVVVGSPIAGRNRAETEDLIGFFVNTLVMRTDLSGDPSFRELLERVKEVALGAYAHQDLPFEKLVEVVQPERSLSHHPLFQVMFQLIGTPSPGEEEDEDFEGEEPGEREEMEVVEGTAKFDLGLDIFEDNGSLTAAVEYSTGLFEHATISRMLFHFRILLESIATDPDRQISKLSFLPEAEREEILWQWNSTRSEYAQEKCIHELFEAQVERTPGGVAVISEGEQLTYAELNERANRLAHHLRRLGVGPEVLVGICVERSLEMMVGLLGILKAGGAYMPLDPDYPKQRLAFMLEDAGASVLLTQSGLLSVLPEHRARTVCLDRDEIGLESETNLQCLSQPQNLAYVIYTSGSTGQPKGVMIQHRSLVNWTVRASVEYDLKHDDRILQFSSISFDTAAEEIYPCLTLGATLILRSDSMSTSIAKLLEKSRELKITVLDLPTAFWHELTWELATQNLKLPPSVRLVITGGEKALPERLSMWHRSVRGDVRLMQGYGPTEVTVVATIADLTKYRAAETALKEVPIGRVIGNAQAYILDRRQQPVPIGVTGELYIGGDGLARGYLNGPSLTAERFIPNPFSPTAGERLYRTGDEARFLANGEIEFLGRRDEQVKIRGYRIELGEIEAQLREDREVREAVVMAREDMGGEKRLVAYVVADQGNGFSVSELRRLLGERLPEYMLPSAFVLLEQLPLTANGKLDRRALPEPSQHHEAASIYVPPRTELERLIAATWQEVFRVEKLSVHSNFFDLGGHSLTLVRVHSMLRNRLHKEISMIDMFRYPTINSLSDYLSREQPVRAEFEPPRYQQIYDRAEKQKDALSRRKHAMRQRAMTNE